VEYIIVIDTVMDTNVFVDQIFFYGDFLGRDSFFYHLDLSIIFIAQVKQNSTRKPPKHNPLHQCAMVIS
jgi:hypothetical protein